MGDLLESVTQKFGMRNQTVTKTIAAIRYSIDKVGGVGNGGDR
jgi:hypothetical protein